MILRHYCTRTRNTDKCGDENYAERQLNAVVGQLAADGWRILDTTTLSVDATVAAILNQEEQHLLEQAAYLDREIAPQT